MHNEISYQNDLESNPQLPVPIPTNNAKHSKAELVKNYSITALSVLLALPISVLNGLAATTGRSGNLYQLDSLKAIEALLTEAPAANLSLGILSFVVSQAVLTGLNKKYLIDSTKSVLDLIKRDVIFLKSLLSKDVSQRITPSLIENILFAWCFLTSLIFAELGKETLAFLGTAGEQFGFYLNLLVFFSTRFSAARMTFENYLQNNASYSDIEVQIQSHSTAKEKTRLLIGYGLALLCALPITVNCIPESVQGLQSLFQSSLGADQNYQNVAAITLGIVCTLPTLFFYSNAIKELPNQLAKTISNAPDATCKEGLILFALTFAACLASCFSSIGFRLVGSTNVENGYLSYLGSPLESIMPAGFFLSCILMFWSHLQELVNERPKPAHDRFLSPRLGFFTGNRAISINNAQQQDERFEANN